MAWDVASVGADLLRCEDERVGVVGRADKAAIRRNDAMFGAQRANHRHEALLAVAPQLPGNDLYIAAKGDSLL